MTLKPEIATELRQMVREVLREVMAQRAPAQPAPSGGVETVRLANDHDLAAFVARITEPAMAEKIRAGRLRFTLGPGPAPAAAAPSAALSLTGVITEQKLGQFKGQGRIVLEPGAVLTPLARDKARRLGLTIERRR